MDDRHPHGGGSSGRGSLSTTTYRAGNSVVIALAGEIDLLTEPVARAALDGVLADLPSPAGPSRAASDRCDDDAVSQLVMNLTEVTFLSSKGVQLLITADRAAAERDLALHVVTGSSRAVLRLLQISGLDVALATYPTAEEAVAGRMRRVSDSPRAR